MFQKRTIITILLCVLFVGIIYYFGSGAFYKQRQSNIVFTNSSLDCNLHKSSCEVKIDDSKSIILDIANRPFTSKKEIDYQVKTIGFQDNDMTVSIVGVDMNMGLYEKKLTKNSSNYSAKLSLPSCINGLMKWRISVVANKQLLGANFIVDIE